MSTAISGLNTTLYCGDSATALTKLCDIKDVPDLISEPNLLDATTLSDPMQVNIFGIIQSDTKSFTANYNKTDYKKVKEAGYDVITPIIVCNTPNYPDMVCHTGMQVKELDPIIEL